jgi:hypothetical protein
VERREWRGVGSDVSHLRSGILWRSSDAGEEAGAWLGGVGSVGEEGGVAKIDEGEARGCGA